MLLAAVLLAGSLYAYLATRLVNLDSWRNDLRVAHGIDADGHPWLGATHPKLIVEEFVDYACPHCDEAHIRVRTEVTHRAELVRLVRHDYARMACLPIPKKSWVARCVYARTAYCAGKQKRFWPMNDWLFTHPSLPKKLEPQAAAKNVGVTLDAFVQCLDAPTTYEAVHREYQHAKAAGVRGTPAYVVHGKRLTTRETIEAIRNTH